MYYVQQNMVMCITKTTIWTHCVNKSDVIKQSVNWAEHGTNGYGTRTRVELITHAHVKGVSNGA